MTSQISAGPFSTLFDYPHHFPGFFEFYVGRRVVNNGVVDLGIEVALILPVDGNVLLFPGEAIPAFQPGFDHIVRISRGGGRPKGVADVNQGRSVGEVEEQVDIPSALVVEHAAAVFAKALPVAPADIAAACFSDQVDGA